MKSGVYGATGMTSDSYIDVVPLVVACKKGQFMDMIVKTNRDNHVIILDTSHLWV